MYQDNFNLAPSKTTPKILSVYADYTPVCFWMVIASVVFFQVMYCLSPKGLCLILV